ncbi:LytTR family DNA-binding domain-containing protein [Sporofaciens sp. JLR.KK001]|jgi:two-component system response regulator LytT|uniref:LytR/AlgR family response regulator transcription factor n=1 Tax=Sporofaciens sp. JLR.KK001 TaxID=3112621 RepID=UPI002FF255CC
MIIVAICEDERYILEELRRKVEKYINRKSLDASIKTFMSGEELLKAKKKFDIILLDLMLPGIDGLEVARQISCRSRIIFVTSYREYAVEAFDANAVHYLVKPVTEERLFLALDRAVNQTEQMDNQSLTLMKSGKTQVIFIRDILYCEVFNHQVRIHTVHGTYDYFGTLDMLETKLDERFFRCHRSFVVNMSCVAGQEKGVAILTNGEKIFISRRKQTDFIQRLLNFLKNEVI